MSSDSFTIPKKKRQDSTPGSALLPAQQDGQAAQARPNRKVLPTRASRISDARDTPEWEAMSKLISQFYARADAGKLHNMHLIFAFYSAYILCIVHLITIVTCS